MSLYRLMRMDSTADYDILDAVVVRAADENEARKLARKEARNASWRGKIWPKDESEIECVLLEPDGRPEILLADWKMG